MVFIHEVGFVWRQLGLAFFGAVTPVAALFVFTESKNKTKRRKTKMKKLLPLIAIVLLLVLLVACDKTPSNPNNGENDTTPPNYEDNGDIPPPDNKPKQYLLKTYSSTDEYGNAGTYTEINSQYVAGDAIELEATVKSGYNFVGWFINGTCISEDLKYTLTMKSNDIEVEARYNYFTVVTSSYSDDYEKAGIYTKLDNKKISIGEQVTVEATVNTGYNFEGWFINDVCVSEDLIYSFVMKSKNVELQAKFSSYTVTAYSDSNLEGTIGTYTQINEKKVSAGDTITLTAQAAKGCNFEGWYIWTDWHNSICVCEDLEYTFEMGKEDVRIEARFSAYTLTTDAFLKTDKWKLDTIKPGINIDFFLSYSFSAYDPSMGDYTQYKNIYVAAGEEVTLIATEKSGYTFLGWKRGFDLVSTSHTYTFVMGKTDMTYEAVYIINE